MKVLQVFGHLNFCGAESRMMDVYRNINRDEVVFDFLSQTGEKGDFEEEIEALGGKVVKITPPRQCGIFKHIKELREVFRKGKYDGVHAHTLHQCGIILLAAYLEGVPVRIAHARNSNSSHKGFKNRIQVKIGIFLIKLFATDRIAVSHVAGDFLFGRSPFKVIPNAIDIEKYQHITQEQRDKIKSEFNLDQKTKVIGHIGRFEPMKNHTFIIEWFEDFHKSFGDSYRLMLVGEGSLFDEIKALVHAKGLDDFVIFTGKRDDVPSLLKVFDILILPSLFEGLPGVVLEAQASGLHSAVADTVTKEADMGLGLVDYLPLELKEWKELVYNKISEERPKNEMILSAFEKKGFTIKSTAEKYIQIYKGK